MLVPAAGAAVARALTRGWTRGVIAAIGGIGVGMLESKVVVVTGGGRGLGLAYSLQCAAAGAAVVVNDINADVAEGTAEAIRAAGGKARADAGSVADWEYCEQLVERTVAAYGRIDGLVNNAGLYYVSPAWEDDPARVRRLIEVNVLGTLYCGAAALRRMVAQGSGSVVNVTPGAHAGLPSMPVYGASKGAVASYTYNAALDAMPFGVRVNAVSPVAMTRMGRAQDGTVSDEVADVASSGPAELSPANVAPLIVYLLSDRAADVTGQVVRLQGRTLSLIEHPVPAGPAVERERWTAEAIGETFERELRGALRPVGLRAESYAWEPGTAV
ncbi:MAG: SDR family oxidoreductase [Dehalococcoidia bacterium]|nr:SDR family oxidoreductase [Dehalococcoidia bacterium]